MKNIRKKVKNIIEKMNGFTFELIIHMQYWFKQIVPKTRGQMLEW